MSAKFVNGRLLLNQDDEETDQDVALTKTRSKFQSLGQQYKDEEETRRWGEHRERKSMVYSKMAQEGVGLDSDSEYEPEESIISLSVGMIPEFVINILIFLKVCIGFYVFAAGLSSMRWKASVQSFVNPHYDSDFESDTATLFGIIVDPDSLHYSEDGMEPHPIDLIWLGIAIMFIAIMDNIFCLILWHSVFYLRKPKIITFCFLTILMECCLTICAWLSHSYHRCDTTNIETLLEKYFKHFGNNSLATRKINELQFDIACCGMDNWTDFIALNKSGGRWGKDNHFYPQKHQTLVPYSCCRFPWNSNLYCGCDGEDWAAAASSSKVKEDIKRRFYTSGCSQQLKLICQRIISVLSLHLEVVSAVDLVLNGIIFLMVYFIIQKINLMRLEAESLYDFNKLEIFDNTFESDDSAEFDRFSDEGGGDSRKSGPTLKEIYEEMNLVESHGVVANTKLRNMLNKLEEEEDGKAQGKQQQQRKKSSGARLDGSGSGSSPAKPSTEIEGTDAAGQNPQGQTQTPNPYRTQQKTINNMQAQNTKQKQQSKSSPKNVSSKELTAKTPSKDKAPPKPESKPDVHKKQPMVFAFGVRQIAK